MTSLAQVADVVRATEALTASMALKIGAGLSTMPAPPPYGLSSAVLCLSSV